ncbi:MAG TPA: LysM peptidoglycan-binding domain-containing protein, partial [Bacillota bacterium]|nr:LysM peptidoglycan-binding domain-containing protein [Bacillota bacterium]
MSNSENYLFTQALTCPAGSTPYTIQAGDTFYTIAQRLGTTVAAITALNPGVNPGALQVGQQICVPGGTPGPGPGTCPGGTLYTVRAGDTFYALAVRYGVSMQALLAANPGVDPNRLAPGMRICIPGTQAPPPVTLIQTPFCSLLRPILSEIPAVSDIPIGSVTVRQVAMSTRAYTIVAAPLPDPAALGNYNGYVGVLSLI